MTATNAKQQKKKPEKKQVKKQVKKQLKKQDVATSAAPRDAALRAQLRKLLDWEDAHVSLDSAIAKLPPKLRGVKPEGLRYSIWQLVEHLRLVQFDQRRARPCGRRSRLDRQADSRSRPGSVRPKPVASGPRGGPGR